MQRGLRLYVDTTGEEGERRDIMSLYFREAGPQDAPTVLFLHGLGLSHTMWNPQIEGLSDYYHCMDTE